MAILSEIPEAAQEKKPSSPATVLPFNSSLDPSNPLGFIESAFDFAYKNSNLFKSDSAEKQIASLAKKTRERVKAEESEKAKKAQEKKIAEEEGEKKESNELIPNQSNGLDMENHSWGQSLQEVTITVPVPPGTKAKDVVCDIKANSLKVGLKGQPPVIEGDLFASVRVDDAYWSLEDHKTISVLLTKREKSNWWKSLVKGGPQIDTQKAEPETSRLSDLDGETRSVVEKMMFDQRQKHMGLPTSQDIANQEMLKKFMAQNPNFDFSKAKMT